MPGSAEDGNNNVYNYFELYRLNNAESEPGYLRELPREESESLHLMQNMGLIQKSKNCVDCNISMEWYPARTVDLFKWVCPQCTKSCSIKQGSPLETIDCSYDKVLGVLGAWCRSEEIDKTAIRFGIKPSTVMNIFSIAGLAAEKHIERNISQWKIGGPGIIVLIDTFPDKFFSGNRSTNRPILCLAELQGFPLTIVFHPLQTDLNNQQEDMDAIKDKCQSVIRKFVHPESAVVARRNATFCSYKDILYNQPQFNVLASDEGLLKHESVGRSLQNILSTIWERAVYVCMNAQYYPNKLMQSFLISKMWKDKFSDQAYSLILKEISYLANDML